MSRMYLDDPAMTLLLVKDDNLTVSEKSLNTLLYNNDDYNGYMFNVQN